ncbi:hypothetical protein WKT22_03979 [Candidatus Lokiarchaeum ossiferum]
MQNMREKMSTNGYFLLDTNIFIALTRKNFLAENKNSLCLVWRSVILPKTHKKL